MSHFEKINVGVKHFEGRDEHRTSSLCGVSTFLNKLSPAQHAYFKKSEHPFTKCKVKIIAYADPDCCFFTGGRKNAMLDSCLNCRGGGGEGGGNTCIPKQTYILVICQDARAHVCVFVSVYVGCLEPHSPPLDPYIFWTHVICLCYYDTC